MKAENPGIYRTSKSGIPIRRLENQIALLEV